MDTAIKVEGLTKEFFGRTAVDNLSFSVKCGQIHGFLGPNGAGKTTTMRMIAGLIRPSSGSINILNKDVESDPYSIKNHLGVLLETPPVYKDMLVKDYLIFIGKLRGLRGQALSEALDKVLCALNIKDVSSRMIGNLSKGYKQRVGVAQAIMHSPDIVILDEPTVGLDPNAVIEMRELIVGLKKDHTILLSSHILHEVGKICDEVTIISHGQLMATGKMQNIAQKIADKKEVKFLIEGLSQKTVDELQAWQQIQKIEVKSVGSKSELLLWTDVLSDIRPQVVTFLVNQGISIFEITQEEMGLEKIFYEVTRENK